MRERGRKERKRRRLVWKPRERGRKERKRRRLVWKPREKRDRVVARKLGKKLKSKR